MWWSVALSLVLAAFAAWTAVRLLGVERGYPAMPLISFTPYVAATSVLPLVAALVTRQCWHAAAATMITVTLAGCVLPRATPRADVVHDRDRDGHGDRDGHRHSHGHSHGAGAPPTGLRVLTANVLFGRADPEQLLAVIRDRRVDLLALQEITPGGERALDAAGLASLLPYRVSHPEPGSEG